MMIDVFSACVKVVCKMCSKALNVVLNCEKNVKKNIKKFFPRNSKTLYDTVKIKKINFFL